MFSRPLLLAFAALAAAIPAPQPTPFAVLPRQWDNSTNPAQNAATSPTTTTVTTTSILVNPQPTETGGQWHINLNVGSSSFNIGDYDSSQFPSLFDKACGPNGCDGGSPQSFEFEGVSGGFVTKLDGTVTLSGFVDDDETIVHDLLTALNAALQASKSCQDETAEKCSNSDLKRESGTVALDCDMSYKTTQCTLVNYVQAVMYDPEHSVKGQITFNGASESGEFDCDQFFGILNGAATAADLDPIVVGGTVAAQVICNAFEG